MKWIYNKIQKREMHMKKKKRVRKSAAIFTSLLLLAGTFCTFGINGTAAPTKINPDDLADSLTYFEVQTDNDTYINSQYYKTATKTLGIVNGFHIVAFQNVSLNSHTNGNVLAKSSYFGANAGTNDLENEVSYVENSLNQNIFKPMSNTTSLFVVGYNNTLSVDDNGNAFSINGYKIDNLRNLASDTEVKKYIELDKVRSQIVNISQQLFSLSGTLPSENISLNCAPGADFDMNDRYVQISDISGMNVYHMPADEMEQANPPIYFKGFTDCLNNKGSLVLNIDLAGHTDYKIVAPLNMVENGIVLNNQERNTWEYGKILYNFYDSSSADKMYHGKITFTGRTFGTIIAPYADITIQQNLDGNIIGNSVTVNAQTHRCDFTGALTNISVPDYSGIETDTPDDSSSDDNEHTEDKSSENGSSVDNESTENNSTENNSSVDNESTENNSTENDSSVDNEPTENNSTENDSSTDNESTENNSSEKDSSVDNETTERNTMENDSSDDENTENNNAEHTSSNNNDTENKTEYNTIPDNTENDTTVPDFSDDNNSPENKTTNTDEKVTGNLVITVVENGTNRIVPGAKTLITYPDKTTETLTTDRNGQIIKNKTPIGKYTVEILSVPKGYRVNTNTSLNITVVPNETAALKFSIEKSSSNPVSTGDIKFGALFVTMFMACVTVIMLQAGKKTND